MDTYMHKTMVSVESLGKIEIIISRQFMPREVRLKFLKIMIILGPKTAILGPQFCRILVLVPHFWWSGGVQAPRAPGSAPEFIGYYLLEHLLLNIFFLICKRQRNINFYTP